MYELQTFSNSEFGQVRTVTINGEPWFVGSDIAKALGYAKPQNAVAAHCKHSLKQGIGVQTGHRSDGTPSIQEVEMVVIPEGDMYRLISRSKLKSAEKFEEWVFDEVLPSIRMSGQYGQPQLPQTTDGKIALLAQGHQELRQDIDSIKNDLEHLKMDLPILPIEAERITNATRAKGVSVMGGKNSNAYANRSIVNAVYRDIYGQIYRNFGVSSYKAIKRSQTDKVIVIIEEYKPPVVLQDRIDSENAQQSLELEGGAVQ